MKQEEQGKVKEIFFKKEKWEAKKQKLRENFSELTDEDLSPEEGKEDGMMESIHSKIGDTIMKTREGLHKFINGL